jgi:hypothetical protein
MGGRKILNLAYNRGAFWFDQIQISDPKEKRNEKREQHENDVSSDGRRRNGHPVLDP